MTVEPLDVASHICGMGDLKNYLSLGATRNSGSSLTFLGSLYSPVPQPPAIGGFLALGSQPVPQWIYLRRRMMGLMSEIDLTEVQRRDGTREQLGLRATLNRAFWGSSSETDNSALVGSWGKDTRVRPPRDIDVLFLLPPALYHQFQGRSGNRQSQLLQHVKGVLEQSYSRTTMRGDGQVIIVPFVIPIEVAIGFACQDGSIIVCDTNNGGTYRSSTAAAEASNISLSDLATHGNTRALIRMLKQWQRHRGVPLKSFQLESLAVDFLWLWSFSGRDIFWYDWMMRDFFAYLVARANGQITMPGTGEALPLGTDWCRHAQQAHADAISACDAERDNDDFRAGLAWQAIFGSAAPLVLG